MKRLLLSATMVSALGFYLSVGSAGAGHGRESLKSAGAGAAGLLAMAFSARLAVLNRRGFALFGGWRADPTGHAE